MAKSSYLSQLPRTAQRLGNASKGEIEIITRKKKAKKIDRETASELEGSALGKGGKRIGILLEDDVHMVVRDPVEYPSGATGARMRIIGKTQFDGVNGIVALTVCEGVFYMRKIFRHPTRSWELEAVRGRRESGQRSSATARKEIKEELGFPVRKLTKIGTICPETALMSSILDVYWAELGVGPQRDDPEEKEAFGEMRKMSPQEVADAVLNGEIRDGYTIAALMLAQLAGMMQPLPARQLTVTPIEEGEPSVGDSMTPA
jgi:ADP-ribose pyrophosphatase